MFVKILPQEVPKHLEALSAEGALDGFYLSGGTGAALQLGHRLSLDLDFFSREEFDPATLAERIDRAGRFSAAERKRGTLHGAFEGTRMSFLHYPYPLLARCGKFRGAAVADLKDIAAMKIDAVASRGSRKDFIDLYFLCRRRPLGKWMAGFAKKYRGVDYNLMHILKGLCYFEDADREAMPRMLKPARWQDVKAYFKRQVPKLYRKLLRG